MSLIGNIIWFVFGGFLLGLLYIVFGLLWCITIIFAPFGYQLIKIGLYAMCPFGHDFVFEEGSPGCLAVVFDILWILFGGVELALVHLFLGLIFCMTIIGIPFGIQHFKLAMLALVPFGQGRK